MRLIQRLRFTQLILRACTLTTLLAAINPMTVAADAMLPDGERVTGTRQIKQAWLIQPTSRYQHAILGDSIEAGGLSVIMRDGSRHRLLLDEDSVFEDRYPRLADLDGDGEDEIYLVHSYLDRGAALAVYEADSNGLRKGAETPALGIPNRWLNPVGSADFDGDGKTELALVTTPHIGGTLVIYRYDRGEIQEAYRLPGFSNHAIGSREMRLSAIVDANGDRVPDLAVPSSDRTQLRILTLKGASVNELKRVRHPSPISSAIDIVRPQNGDALQLSYKLADGHRVLLDLR